MTPWPEVTRFYQDLAGMEPMLALVQYLAASRYARALHAHPAPDALALARTPDALPGVQQLRIAFDARTRRFTFSYLERPGEPNPWSRDCDAAEWRPVLERVLHKKLQWFHEG